MASNWKKYRISLTFFDSNMWRIVTAGHVTKDLFYYIAGLCHLQFTTQKNKRPKNSTHTMVQAANY